MFKRYQIFRADCAILWLLPLMLSFSGCSNSPEDEFLEKLRAQYDKEGEQCFGMWDLLDLSLYELDKIPGKYFVSAPSKTGKQDRARVMIDKLMQGGYIENTKPTSFKGEFGTSYDGYPLTEKGSKYIRWKKGICVGRVRVNEIQEYTEPSEAGGMKITEVTYSYETDFNDIVRDLGLEKKLLEDELDGTGKAVFIKTNKGWRLDYAKL